MDEPCSALDPIATAKIEDLIFDLKKDFTLVIVTHNMQQAARVAETTAFMYLGKLIEVCGTRELFERPGETLTESYITASVGWCRSLPDGRPWRPVRRSATRPCLPSRISP